jgi:ribosomal-protein-alanine N-acetyltransferase
MRAPDIVTTERLTGRRARRDDLSYVFEIDRDPRVQRTLFGQIQTEEQSRDRLERWLRMWEEHGFGFWLFADGSRNTIGHAGVFPSVREPGEVEVGYVLKPAYWGQGFATEMTLVALQVGFERLGLKRIIAIAQDSNVASRRVMEKCGLTLEAQLPSLDGVPGVRYAIAVSH